MFNASDLFQMSSFDSPRGMLVLKWDPKNLEIRTKSVEKTLEPLVTQVGNGTFVIDVML